MRIAPFLRFLLKPETVTDGDKNVNNPIYTGTVLYGLKFQHLWHAGKRLHVTNKRQWLKTEAHDSFFS